MDEPRDVFRKIIKNEWLTPLKKLGFKGTQNCQRVIASEGLVQILNLDWSRYNSADHVALRVKAGVGVVDEAKQAPYGISHCRIVVDVPAFHGHFESRLGFFMFSNYRYTFGNAVAARAQEAQFADLKLDASNPNHLGLIWESRRYPIDDMEAARRVLREDFTTFYLPFFERIATKASYEALETPEQVFALIRAE